MEKPVDSFDEGKPCNSRAEGAAASGSRLDIGTSRLDQTCRLDEMPLEKPVDWIEAEASAEETLVAARTEKPSNLAQSDEKFNNFQSRKN